MKVDLLNIVVIFLIFIIVIGWFGLSVFFIDCWMKRKYSKNNIIIKLVSFWVIWIDILIYDCYFDKIKNLNIFFF